MKRNILYTLCLALVFSCTGDFENINNNPNGLEDTDIPTEFYFAQPQYCLYLNDQNRDYEFQLDQNLNADMYSGYLAVPTPFAGNNSNSQYAMMSGWNNQAYTSAQLGVMKPTGQIIKNSKLPDYIAIAKILRVAGMHKASDYYGPISYSGSMSGLNTPYDKQSDVYARFFVELDESVTALTNYLDNDLKGVDNKDANRINGFDLMCGGSYVRWIRFANTLRLRLAMRIVKVNPSEAQKQAEAAVNQKYGVLTDADQDIQVVDKNLFNPLQTIAYGYNDTRVGASVVSIMSGLNDPRLPRYVTPVGWYNVEGKSIDIKDKEGKPLGYIGKYVGIRQGIIIPDKNDYVMYSNINMANSKTSTANPLPVMKVAEAYFLRAEGKLRKWNMGSETAEQLYRKGIGNSFSSLGINAGLNEYLSSTSKPADYVDPFNPKYNLKAVSNVTVAWNEGDNNETKLEKIITQKWIAMFPEGKEAWAEFRRTGYPKLFPVAENRSNGVIPDGEFIKRLPFTETEYSTNRAEVVKAVGLLGGPDNINTRLWWDVNAPNF